MDEEGCNKPHPVSDCQGPDESVPDSSELEVFP